jgi:branched-chain amino acid transport system permease protein
VRIIDFALLYVLLALGLNIVVGYAGLLDLGYVAFYAVGAYMFALMASPHLAENFETFAAFPQRPAHARSGWSFRWGRAAGGLAGMLLGAPTLKLRGDYLAIVTLGFGEIIRVFMNNLDRPVNITNGPKGLSPIDSHEPLRHGLRQDRRPVRLGDLVGHASTTTCSWCWWWSAWSSATGWSKPHRPRLDGHPRRRDRRQGHGHQHPQPQAAGLRHGRHLRRRVGGDVRHLPGLRLARVVQLQESVMIVAMVVLGGMGHIPGVILGAVLLAALPEVLRYVAGPGPAAPDRRPHRRGHPAPAADRAGDDHHHAAAAARPVAIARARQGRAPAGQRPQDRGCQHERGRAQVKGVSKRFGGLQALSDVGITIQRARSMA